MDAGRGQRSATCHSSALRLLGLGVVAGLLHGVLMALAFPLPGVWWLAFAAIAPLVWFGAWLGYWERSDRMRRVAPIVGVMIGAMPLWAYQSQWVIDVSAAGFVPMVPGLAAFPGAFVWLLARSRSRLPAVPLWIAGPLLWTALEVFRGEVVVYGYAWMLVGHPLIDAPVIGSAVAAVGGQYLASLVAAGVASALVAIPLAEQRAIRPGVVAIAVIGVLAGGLAVFGASRISARPAAAAASLRVAVVQTNIPQSNKMDWPVDERVRDLLRMLELTREAARGVPKPDVIVWPETMFPGDVLSEAQRPDGVRGFVAPDFVDALLRTQAEIGVPLLVGATGADNLRLVEDADGGLRLELDGRFNSVFQVAGGAVDPVRYDKVELTPFGEIMPYVHHFPALQQRVLDLAARGMRFDLTIGAEARVLRLRAAGGEVALATPICFESTKSRHVLRLARAAGGMPMVLVNISNDGWFGSFDVGKEQHLQLSRWRAAELGVPAVRSVNTGSSCAIDASGRVIRSEGAGPLPHRVDGIAAASVTPAIAATVFVRGGWLTGWVALAIGSCLGLLALFRGRAVNSAVDRGSHR